MEEKIVYEYTSFLICSNSFWTYISTLYIHFGDNQNCVWSLPYECVMGSMMQYLQAEVVVSIQMSWTL